MGEGILMRIKRATALLLAVMLVFILMPAPSFDYQNQL